MKRDDLTTDTVYAVKDYPRRQVRPTMLLSTEPHELVHQMGRADPDGPPYALRTDTGQYTGYGSVSRGGGGRDAVTRGLPALIARGGPQGPPTLRELEIHAERLGRDGFTGPREMEVFPGLWLGVVRTRDVETTWAAHQEAADAEAERLRLRRERTDAEIAEGNAAHARVTALLERWGVTVTPPLADHHLGNGVPIFGGCTWDSLEALLIKVAASSGDEADEWARSDRRATALFREGN